ncbi:ubiquitin-conjugating enzyme E2 [Sporobolomyces koalae]|uniref:ubiquitin-conjugating enzyme E2 n=1 Tax=Sporobolomyces koalae TaxID=500713 RepID=UPI003177411A
MSATPQARKRLQKEHAAFQKNPPPFIWARPNESNILEWHYLFKGAPDTPYSQGEYWGTVEFPRDYPFAPPRLKMNTPSGRFTPSAAICTSMSDFHPGSWNVAWSIETILIGLQSFMNSDEITTGSIKTTDDEKRQFATRSHDWNIQQPKFKTMFPEYAQKEMKDVPNMIGGQPVASSSNPTTAQVSPFLH